MNAYKTIQGTASAEYEEKKSRFIAQLAHVETEQEAVAFLDGIRAANPMARHNVYAYVLRANNRVRYSDDGEPARTSGLPTLEVIERAGLKDVICVTTRYFGGTLLGTGGLVRAYTKAAQDALAQATVVTYAECVDIVASVPYALYDQVSYWLSEQGIQVLATDFAGDVVIDMRVRAEDSERVQKALGDITRAQADCLVSEPAFNPIAVE